jgi:hypothetical protein
MTDYSLIKSLQEPKEAKTQPLLPEGIKYDEYEVETYDSGTITVHVPLSEASAFEQSLISCDVIIRSDIRNLMRKHRGIIGK